MKRVTSLLVTLLVVGMLAPVVSAGDQSPVVAVFNIEDTREGEAKLVWSKNSKAA